jgi:hypothetical protein
VGLVRTDVSEKRIASIFRYKKFTSKVKRQQLANKLFLLKVAYHVRHDIKP